MPTMGYEKVQKEIFKEVQKPLPAVPQKTFNRRTHLFYVFLSILILVSVILTTLAKQYPYFDMDLKITLAVQSIEDQWFLILMKSISELGDNYMAGILMFLIPILFFIKNKRLEAYFLFISTFGAQTISTIMKALTSRQRPDPDLINQIGNFIKNDSFPSGHVSFFVGLFGFLTFLIYTEFPKSYIQRVVLAILMFLIYSVGISRIYLGAHWFSDVMGAYLISLIWVSIVAVLFKKFKEKKPK